MTRRDMESYAGRFWRFENTSLNLEPVDPSQPRLGGRVTASVKGFDVTTFAPFTKTYHGVYGEDFITYGEWAEGSPDNEEQLLQIFEDSAAVVDKHHFKFANNRVYYSRHVNGEVKDKELEHAIEESELTQAVAQTWAESLFYGAGNKAI